MADEDGADVLVFLPFSEAAGGATPDVAGGRSGLLKGGASLTEAGRSGPGLALPGAGGFLELDGPGFGLAEGALDFWIRPDAVGTLQGLAGRDAAGLGAGEMSLLLRADGRVSFRLEAEDRTYYAQSQRALEAGDWAHVAVSWGEGGMRLHLDGALDGVAAYAGGLAEDAGPWVFGANASLSAAGGSAGLRDHFRGAIDEVRLRGAAGPDDEPDQAAAAPLLSFAGQTGRAKAVDLARGFWAEAPRVMPLGDSNTLGLSKSLPAGQLEGYRRALWSQATEDQVWIDYVGGRSNGPASLPDRNHQGVSGIRATAVVEQAQGLAAQHRPDVVLLMLGTNDALNEANAASTVPGELLSIMRGIDAVQPDATILLAPLPPIDPGVSGFGKRADADDIRAAINAQLPALAAQARGQGVDARFVPMSSLGTGDLYDGIHLTGAGHARIAAAWYGALEDGLAGGEFGGARRATAGVRDVTGSEAGDHLRGDAAVNKLSGRAGADRIEGGPGADVLTGGGGADTFVFRAANEGGDRITDFRAEDFIEIRAAGFGGGLDPGDAVVLRSAATPRVQGGAGQFLYDRDDGRLSWDPDGTGPAPAVPIATLTGAPALGAGDFLVL